jgi:putative hydrolase of HD superfamily
MKACCTWGEVILATLLAGLIGKAGGMIWSHARILLELRRLRRRLRAAPPLVPGEVARVQAAPVAVATPSVQDRMPAVVAFLTDLERLKLVSRKAYVSDLSRRENSAEHSWHLALGLLTLAHELNLRIDLHKALVMALIHDTCEIDAGDSPIYGPVRHDQHEAELACVNRLASHEVKFGQNLRELWLEFEAQQSRESRWVKVLDRVMPFVVNLATEGRTWKELSVRRSQVLQVSKPVQEHAPEIYAWMEQRSEECVRAGWLIDG